MKKTLTICGSIQFFQEMLLLKEQLQGLGFEVLMPSKATNDLIEQKAQTLKQHLIDEHISKIRQFDAILVANMKKTIFQIISAQILS